MSSALEPRWATPELHAAIKDHYDGLIDIYQDLWGEHIHHGYWAEGEADPGRHAAQERLVKELITFAPVPEGAKVLDAGCGIGASAIDLAKNLGCQVDGITLSAEQVQRAENKAREAGVADRTRFQLMDAMHTEYPDGTFDVVWALESCELMPDKEVFFAECRRVLRPGGTLMVATWCARDEQLTSDEARLLERIYRDFVVSHVLPLDTYAKLAADLGLTDVRTADWSERTQDTWKLTTETVKPVVRDPTFIWRLIRAKGMDIFRFLNSVPLMKQAYERGIMRYGVLRATVPAADQEGSR
jgi:tocopherol O-methyltransferase